MRYAVLSDVHGNLEALTAVLAMLSSYRIDRYLCLGDVVGYGAEPAACLHRLRALDAVIVAGNHEQACIGKLDLNWFHEAAQAAILWTRDRLSITELDVLRRLPLTDTTGPVTLVHATLKHPERFEYLVDIGQAVDALTLCRTLICAAGHTHLPCFLEYDRAQRRVLRVLTAPNDLEQVAFVDDAQSRRYLLNPGSVGQPRDGDARASVAVIDTDAKRASVHRVPYDVAAAQQKIRQAGLPALLAERLALGR